MLGSTVVSPLSTSLAATESGVTPLALLASVQPDSPFGVSTNQWLSQLIAGAPLSVPTPHTMLKIDGSSPVEYTRWPLHRVSPSGGGGGVQTELALQLQP